MNPMLRRKLLTALAAVAAVVVLGSLVRASAFDLPVTRAMNSLHSGAVAVTTDTIYRLLEPPGAIALTVVTAAVLGCRHRSVRVFLLHGATVALSWLPIVAFKALYQRPRPLASELPYPYSPAQADASFPSGHTAFITVYVIALALTLAALRPHGQGSALAVLGPLLILGVVLTVLINGLHFPTDVLGSLIWAGGVTPAVAALLPRPAPGAHLRQASPRDSRGHARSR